MSQHCTPGSPRLRAFFMPSNLQFQHGTVIATTLLRKSNNNPEHVLVRRSNFIETKET